MEEESLTIGDKIILTIGCAIIGGIIWVIVKIVEAVVSATKATANFVVLNLEWTILGILLFLLIIVLFKHLKYKYIGAAEGEDADPLFTRAAKYVVKKKDKLGSETETVRRLSRKFRIGEDRAKFLLLQLEYADILRKGVDSSYEVLLKNLWKLHGTFAGINAESDYFEKKIEVRIATLEEPLQKQADNEAGGWKKQLLLALRCNISTEVALPYYKLLLATGTSSDIIEMAKERISIYESKAKQITITDTSNHMQSMRELCNDLSGYTIYNMKRMNFQDCRYERLDISFKSFKGIQVNGKEYDAPCFNLDKEELYLFPSFGIIYKKGSQSIKIIDYKNVSTEIQPREISTDSGYDVSGAEYRIQWKYQRVDGGPDRRHSDNVSEIIYKFYRVILHELNLDLMCTRISTADQILLDFMAFFKSAGSRIIITAASRQSIVPEKENRQAASEESVMDRISAAIKDFNISTETIKNGTFVPILNDYHVFDNLEDKMYAKILKAAADDGTLLIMATRKSSSKDFSAAYNKFVHTSGFDSKKISEVLPTVALALRSS